MKESEGDFQDKLVKQFQETIRNIKTDRKMGELPDRLQERIEKLEELEDLKALHKLAARTDSLQDFEKDMEKYLQDKEKQEESR